MRFFTGSGLDERPGSKKIPTSSASQQVTEGKGYDMIPMDEEAIIGYTAAFSNVWNRADAKAAATFYTEDGVRVGAYGDIQIGRIEIEKAFDRLFHQTVPGASVPQDRRDSPHAFSRSCDLAGMEIVPPGGRPPIKGAVVQVMKKFEGRWLVLESDAKFFPPRAQE